MWAVGLTKLDELEEIEWEWQSPERAMTKAPFGGTATGANPTNRGKRGTVRRFRESQMLSAILGYRMAKPKSNSSRRIITLAPLALQALREHRQRQALGDACDTTYDFVFPNQFGRHRRHFESTREDPTVQYLIRDILSSYVFYPMETLVQFSC